MASGGEHTRLDSDVRDLLEASYAVLRFLRTHRAALDALAGARLEQETTTAPTRLRSWKRRDSEG
ncbi:MAG: hypothetical protein ABI613_07560 [Gemmatimonadota bacterium]